MTADEGSSLKTRASLLGRLQGPDDPESWQEFYRLYGPLIRNFALKAGCTDPEADEVVQETAIAAARHLPEFRYDPKVCRFKTWLLNQTSWRVQDQLKKRHRREAVMIPAGEAPGSSQPIMDDATQTSGIQQAPDPRPQELDALWDAEWRSHLLAAAVAAVKPRLNAKQWQVFDLSVLKEWPAGEVAKSLGVSVATIYLAKHRVSAAVKREVKRLESQIELETV